MTVWVWFGFFLAVFGLKN